ncbi:MAG: hypothetical protein P1V29_11190 [Gammaproteobacteria bacterium]|nr:hypothetical protein [Gammaproteobacteria bacterium]
MSLVNDMLRDLDKRRAGDAALGNAGGLSPAQHVTPQSSSKRKVWALSVIAVVSVLLGVWVVGSGTQRAEINIEPLINEQSAVVQAPVAAEVRETYFSADATPEQEVQVVQKAEEEHRVEESSQREVEEEKTVEPSLSAIAPIVSRVADPPLVAEQSEPVKEEAAVLLVSDDVSQAPPAAAVRETAKPSVNELDVMNVQQALGLLAEGKETEAFELLRSYLQRAPASHQSRETLIKLLLSRDAIAEAIALADVGLSQVPNHAGFKKAKARALIANESYAEAAALLIARAPQPGSDVEYFELLASAQLAAQDYSGASQIYSQLLQVDRQQARWWYGYAVAQDSLGESNNARQAYTQALRGTSLSANLRRRSEQRLGEL